MFIFKKQVIVGRLIGLILSVFTIKLFTKFFTISQIIISIFSAIFNQISYSENQKTKTVQTILKVGNNV